MRARKTILWSLALALTACSDDSGPSKVDQKATVPDLKTATGDTGSDKAVGSDKTSGTPKVLTSTHSGWSKTACSGCHTPLPLANHTATKPPECAKCHGGNGSCNPNGANSGKKNHTQTMGCTSCHPNKHSFTANADCVSCHYAASGTADCP